MIIDSCVTADGHVVVIEHETPLPELTAEQKKADTVFWQVYE